MPRLPVRFVSTVELSELFERLGLWEQIRAGTLSCTVIWSSRARNPRYAGGTSQIHVHHDTDGNHRCTTHRIIDSGGNVLHWDEKDVHFETETVARLHM
jgi:hypothetical protein